VDASPADDAARHAHAAAAGGLPDVLPVGAQVKDPVFSVLVGLIQADLYGALTRERLEQELLGRSGRSRLPYRRMRELARVRKPGGATAQVRLVLDSDVQLPIPYSILWYHPGRFATSETCTFREWMLGSVDVPLPARKGAGPPPPVRLDDVHLFALDEGQIEVDIDAWLDKLMGGALDDTTVTGILLCRRQGRWLSVAVGHNKDGRGRAGTFDFARDEIVFPTPPEMKAVAREMRSRLQSLTAARRPLVAE
jgi:hypothetical protein